LFDLATHSQIADLVKLYIAYLQDPSPENQAKIDNASNDIVDGLWHTLHHPPLSFVGDKFQYRSADGSGNVCLLPGCFTNCRMPCIHISGKPAPNTPNPFSARELN